MDMHAFIYRHSLDVPCSPYGRQLHLLTNYYLLLCSVTQPRVAIHLKEAMRPRSSTCFLLALALLLYCHLPPANASVEETCEAAAGNDPNIHYDFCVKSLHEDPGSCSADTKGLAIIAANLSYPRAAATKSKVKSLLRVATDPKAKQCLQTCMSTYSDLISALAESISALEDDRLWDAKTYLSATTESPQDCEDGFKEMRVPSPLSEENDRVGQLCTIALAIATLLG
ncbi:hypothetical protein BHE74_00028531 [Ensete ventricosum]|nr:hypothetical protein BHE74_00028531 [Ensete ventricosum]